MDFGDTSAVFGSVGVYWGGVFGGVRDTVGRSANLQGCVTVLKIKKGRSQPAQPSIP